MIRVRTSSPAGAHPHDLARPGVGGPVSEGGLHALHARSTPSDAGQGLYQHGRQWMAVQVSVGSQHAAQE